MNNASKRKIQRICRKIRKFNKAHNIDGKKVKIIGLAAFLGAITIAGTQIDNEPNVVIASGVDLDNDEFENSIPVYKDGEVIGRLDDHSLVVVDAEKIKDDNKSYTISAMDENGEFITGETYGKYLKKVTTIKESEFLKYDTIYTVIPNQGINLRKSAEITDDNTILSISSGEQVLGTSNISSTEDDFWLHVLYVDSDNNINSGYVASNYLKTVGTVELEEESEIQIPSKKSVRDVINNISLSAGGKVVGIDISDAVNGEQLRRLLTDSNPIGDYTSYINTSTGAVYENLFNTTDLNGKINYVYIQLGASGYKEFNQVENKNLKEQIAVCEELGVPYGFYFYSTSITTDEAEKEVKYINNILGDVSDREYNLLPFAIDVELASAEKDRQYGIDVSEVKAFLANSVKKTQGKTIIYSGERSIASSEKILDLNTYSEETDDSLVWMTEYRLSSGEITQSTKDNASKVEEDAHIAIVQTIGDAIFYGYSSETGTVVDIDVMTKKDYKSMIKNQYKEMQKIKKNKEKDLEEER